LKFAQHDVGQGDEPFEQRDAVGVAEVEAERSLVAVTGGERRRHAHRPGAVGEAAVLDLDDVGALVGEQPTGFTAHDDDAEVEHPEPLERLARRG
jgi:hypothetical protein